MRSDEMFGFLKPHENGGPKGKVITEQELRNIKEQKRILEDSVRVQKMLAAAYGLTLRQIADTYDMSLEFKINFETGELLEEPADG